MRLKKSFLIFFAAFSLHSYAQNFSFTAAIRDTSAKSVIPGASAVLLRAQDSTLARYTWTDTEGKFYFNNVSSGKYIILLSYPGYADYIDTLTIQNHLHHGYFNLITRAAVLQEVIVKQKLASIRMKGDTTEYTADSFKVHANANVEDLLRKLPGIQVDRMGNITAQGQKVKKVLVDGEEFFGSDPTLVTQNLTADMVDKVQVFDKKSDQAVFTGINDGVKDKTINVKLKAAKKSGLFGKISAGAGLNKYYEGQAMVNKFVDKLKAATYAVASNTGVAGLGFKDQQSYGDAGASGALIGDGGGLYISVSNDDDGVNSWSGSYTGRGIPSVQSGGAHFSNKWNNDRNTVNSNYKILQLDVQGITNGQFVNRLANDHTLANLKESFSGGSLRNKLNATYDLVLSPTSSVKISADVFAGEKEYAMKSEGELRSSDLTLLNNSFKQSFEKTEDRFFSGGILWRKKFKKKGRTFSLNLRNNYNSLSSDGYLFTRVHIFKNGSIDSTDQFKQMTASALNIDSKITYTEPLSASTSIVLSYGVVYNNAKSDRRAFDKGGTTHTYTVLNTQNSNAYIYRQFAHRPGLTLNYSKAKWMINAGGSIALTDYKQDDRYQNSSLSRDFINWYPRATLRYSLSAQRQIQLEYSGSSVQPSIQQLQPVLTNEDPLNITIGNPNLRPGFRSNYRITFTDNKDISQRYFFGSLNYTVTDNAIAADIATDLTTGLSTLQWINAKGNQSAGARVSYDLTLKKADVNLSLIAEGNLSRYVTQVNLARVNNQAGSYTLGVYAGKSKTNKYDFRLDLSTGYYTTVSDFKNRGTLSYRTYGLHPSLLLFFKHKIQLHSDLDYTLRTGTLFFSENISRLLWNASVSKRLLKKDNLLLRLSLTDILNRNMSIDRNISGSSLSQMLSEIPARIFLLSATWNFNRQIQK